MEDKSEYVYINGEYSANILVEINYSTEKSLFSIDKNRNSKKFFTKLVYDEESDEWIVTEVENFSL